MKEEMRTFGYLCPQCGKTVMGTRSVFALEASNAEVECACGKSALKVEFDGTEYHIYVPCGICGETHEAHCPPERELRGATALGCAKTRQFCCFIGPEGTVEKNLRDLAVLAELAEQCFPDPWSENVFRQTMCCCYNRIWCAKVDGKLCGYAAVSRTGDAVNLDDIAVSPAFRRQGIGRQLLDWAHGQFPESEFWLEVRESNAAAIALYESAGYRQVGFRKRYYHDPEEGAVLMTREVKKT